MRQLAAALTLSLWSLAGEAAACSPADVETTIHYAPPWTEYTPISELNGKHGAQSGRTWLGRTSSQVRMEVSFRPQHQTENNGQCQTASLQIDLSFAEHEINLAKEIQAFPCIQKSVLEHEEKHATLNKQMLQEMKLIATKYAAERVREILSSTAPNLQGEAIQIFIENDLRKMMTLKWKAMSEQQKELDTPQEYNKLASTCPSEMMALSAKVTTRQVATAGNKPTSPRN